MISGSLLPVTLYTIHLINSWVGQRDDENYCWHVNCWIGDCFFGNYGHGVKNWNSHSHKQHYCSSHFVLFKTQSRKQTFSSQNPWKFWRSYEAATLVRGVWECVRCLFLHIDECGGVSGYQGWGFSLLQYPRIMLHGPKMLTRTSGQHVCKYLITITHPVFFNNHV